MIHEQTMQDRLVNFMYGVYGLMAGALALSAITAYTVSTIPNIQVTLFGSPLLMTLLILGQFGLVIALSVTVQRLSFSTALSMFFIYAIMTGVTLSILFLVYTQASIVQTFSVCAATFGVMSIYGYVTGADLTRMGNVVVMALWGLIVALLINLFVRSPMFDLMISAIGVLIFTLLTAYDTQKIKQIGQQMLGHDEMLGKVAVIGALTLYLDFLNLFLYLLRFMGRRRD